MEEQRRNRKETEENNRLERTRNRKIERNNRELERREEEREIQNENIIQQRDLSDFKSSIRDALYDAEDSFEENNFQKTLKKLERLKIRIKESPYEFNEIMNYESASLFFYLYCFSWYWLNEVQACKRECHKAINNLREEFDRSGDEDEEYFIKLVMLYVDLFTVKHRSDLFPFRHKASDLLKTENCPPFDSISTNIYVAQVFKKIAKNARHSS